MKARSPLFAAACFSEDGHSVPGVRVDLVRIISENSVAEDGLPHHGETGEFVFRLPPDAGKYRLILKADGSSLLRKMLKLKWRRFIEWR
jgi:hypothetical protein